MVTKSFVPAFFPQDLDKFFIGFDDQFKRLQTFHDDVTKNIPNYPPYNIRKNDLLVSVSLRSTSLSMVVS